MSPTAKLPILDNHGGSPSSITRRRRNRCNRSKRRRDTRQRLNVATVKSYSRSVLVGGGGGSGNVMLDELNDTMHDKALFKKTLNKYLPKEKRKSILNELCKILKIKHNAENKQINSIRQCCIDNNNSSKHFESVLSQVVWTVTMLTLGAVSVISIFFSFLALLAKGNAEDAGLIEDAKSNYRMSILAALVCVFSLLGAVNIALNLQTSKTKPILILFRGKNNRQKYNTMKTYLMGVYMTSKTNQMTPSKSLTK